MPNMNAYILDVEEVLGDITPEESVRNMVFTVVDVVMLSAYDIIRCQDDDSLLFMLICREFEHHAEQNIHLFSDIRKMNMLVNETVDIIRILTNRFSHICRVIYLDRHSHLLYVLTR